jgi:MinD superfamily P-loop ATPase
MIISVASGKGGTGKTLVATSLALSLKDRCGVQLLDCDVEEPNDHIFIKPVIDKSELVCIPVPNIDKTKCSHCGRCADVCVYHANAVTDKIVLTFSELCHGCGACSYLCPEKAIAEEYRKIGVVESGQADGIAFAQGRLTVGETMAPPVIRKVKAQANTDGVVIIDAPPGTSCPVVETIKHSKFCILVTEPTPFGLNDLKLAIATVKELGVDCGVVINRVGSGDSGVEDYCKEENIPVLMTIPLDMEIARLYSRGITLAEGKPLWRDAFIGLYKKIMEIIIERNRCLKR